MLCQKQWVNPEGLSDKSRGLKMKQNEPRRTETDKKQDAGERKKIARECPRMGEEEEKSKVASGIEKFRRRCRRAKKETWAKDDCDDDGKGKGILEP